MLLSTNDQNDMEIIKNPTISGFIFNDLHLYAYIDGSLALVGDLTDDKKFIFRGVWNGVLVRQSRDILMYIFNANNYIDLNANLYKSFICVLGRDTLSQCVKIGYLDDTSNIKDGDDVKLNEVVVFSLFSTEEVSEFCLVNDARRAL
jgi:hypothetical protein